MDYRQLDAHSARRRDQNELLANGAQGGRLPSIPWRLFDQFTSSLMDSERKRSPRVERAGRAIN
jgi:hypothetical protein